MSDRYAGKGNSPDFRATTPAIPNPKEMDREVLATWSGRVIRDALKKVWEINNDADNTINLEEFSGIYSMEEIQKDIAEITRLEKLFSADYSRDPEGEKFKKLADIFECIIFEKAEMCEWLGKGIISKTSRFDDVKNGIDLVARYEDQEKPLGLGIDVTYTQNPATKLAKIKTQIDSGALGRIKYGRNSETGELGSVDLVPRVIVGAEHGTVLQLAAMWVEDKKFKKNFDSHPIQLIILNEISAQLSVFSKYASSSGKKDLAKIFDEKNELIVSIISSKERLYSAHKNTGYEKDQVFLSIKDALKKFSAL